MNIAKFSAVAGTSALLGASLIPAGSAFAVDGCGSDATLVDTGICEVTFTETPDSAWTPPAGISKLQALLVGAGGAVGSGYNEYGGGGGEVVLVELATTGDVDITVGVGGKNSGNVAGTNSEVQQGVIDEFAAAGTNSGNGNTNGGNSGNGNLGINYGGGGGAGGDATIDAAGEGVVVSDIATGFELFASDERCFGGGGIAVSYWQDGADARFYKEQASCGGENGGTLISPDYAVQVSGTLWGYVGDIAELVQNTTLANTGNGGAKIQNLIEDGSDGLVAIRYDVPAAPLAATGFDTAGSVVAGAALVAGGAVIATRRRRSSR
jgi:LPXTG-motif cell wall-anchored protein